MSSPSAPAGLIYCGNDGLWATKKDGIQIFLVPDCRADFSSDFQYVFYGDSGEYFITELDSGETVLSLDLWDQENDPEGVNAITIHSATWSEDSNTIYCNAGRFADPLQDIWSLNIKTGKFINLTNTKDRIENAPYLFENNKLLFSSYQFEEMYKNPIFSGYLTHMNRDGAGYFSYSDNESGIFKISPDKKSAATFGGSLFTLENGLIDIEPSLLNEKDDLEYQLTYPEWSPDSSLISWGVEIIENDKFLTGFAIHDIEQNTIELFYPFQQLGGEGFPFPPDWSTTGNWLTLSAFSMDNHNWGIHLIDINGDEVYFYKQVSNIVWNPNSTKMILNSGHLSQSGSGVWIADVKNLEPLMVDLPNDAVVVDWIDPNIVQDWFGDDS